MVVVNEYADTELLKVLKSFRIKPDSTRCIHFQLAEKIKDKQKIKNISDVIISLSTAYILDDGINIYICEDGDIFLLAHSIPTKDAKALIVAAANQSGSEEVALSSRLYEMMNDQLAKLIGILEFKLLKKREAQEAIEKQRQIESAQQRRNDILNGFSIGSSKAVDISNQRKSRAKPSLMIIEDDPFSQRLVSNVLAKDYQLTALENAEIAIATYIAIAPDILFLDINLPDVTGHELLEKITQIDPEAFIVMLSGNSDIDNVRQAMSKGAKGFIAKPFTREKLYQYINSCPTIKQLIHNA